MRFKECCHPKMFQTCCWKSSSQNDFGNKSWKTDLNKQNVSKCLCGCWMFPKIVVPQIIHLNRVFHYFHHPFWGKHPYFWKHPNEPPPGILYIPAFSTWMRCLANSLSSGVETPERINTWTAASTTSEPPQKPSLPWQPTIP